MIGLERLELSETTLEYLKTNASMVMGDKETARNLFSKKPTAFVEIRSTLKWMNGGSESCMYCLSNEGSDIDHFEPITVNPDNAFEWTNYLWACAVCNSNQKRGQFPVEGNQPLLIDPTREKKPHKYLNLGSTGLFIEMDESDLESKEERTARLKSHQTIKVFQLNQRQWLVDSRREAWTVVKEVHLPRYADAMTRGETEQALNIRKLLMKPHNALVLNAFIHIADSSDYANLLIGDLPLAIIEQHPEIREWLKSAYYARIDLHKTMVGLEGKRVTSVSQANNQYTLQIDSVKLEMKGAVCQQGESIAEIDALLNRKLIRYYLEQGNLIFMFKGYRLTAPFDTVKQPTE